MSLAIWHPAQSVGPPVGRRDEETRMAATLPIRRGQCCRAVAVGQEWNRAAALVRERLAALPRPPWSLRRVIQRPAADAQ